MPRRINRRFFLVGAGGSMLAIPLLPSLFASRSASAQPVPIRKRFVQFSVDHGAVWGRNMFPSESLLTEGKPYADRTVRRGDLIPTVADGRAVLSPALTASSAVLTPGISAKLNVVRGLDVPFEIIHHAGGALLGAYQENTGQSDDAQAVKAWPRPSLDQVMAYSQTFYPDPSSLGAREIQLSPSMAFNYADPVAKTGNIQGYVDWGAIYTNQNLFNSIFGSATPSPAPTRPLVIDRVIEDYRRLRNNARLSTADVQRLDAHVQRMYELERKLNAVVSCSSVVRPTQNSGDIDDDFNPDLMAQRELLYLDVVVAAFACQASSIAVNSLSRTYSPYSGDWHQDIAHGMEGPSSQQTYVNSLQVFFEKSFLPFITKLDAVDDGDGKTLLDNTLVAWMQEHGDRIHGNFSVPLITAGSAGGALRTGSFIDYRNPNIRMAEPSAAGADPSFAGLIWNQWLANIAVAMGLPTTEWEEPGGGYGKLFIGNQAKAGGWYPASVQQNLSAPLPYLTPQS